MKFLTLLSVTLLSLDLFACNFVPIFSHSDEAIREKIYQTVTKYSFLRLLDPINANTLSAEELQIAVDDHCSFLLKKFQEVCPNTNVRFIPKSLYQLLAFNYCCEHRKVQVPVFPPHPENSGTPFDIYGYCRSCAEDKDVIDLFWEFNDDIFGKIPKISEEVHGNPAIISGDLLNAMLNQALQQFNRNNLNEMISYLIMNEANAPKNTYRVYKSRSKHHPSFEQILNEKHFEFSYSFGDGFFAGFLLDGKTGSAFGLTQYRYYERVDYIDIEASKILLGDNLKYCFFPPTLPMWSFLGLGEFHHPRAKVRSREGIVNLTESKVEGVTKEDGSYRNTSEKSCRWLFFKNLEAFLYFWSLKPESEEIKFGRMTIQGYEHDQEKYQQQIIECHLREHMYDEYPEFE